MRELTFLRDRARHRAAWDNLPRPAVGAGRPVVLFPGWGANGRSMRFVRSYLEDLGFAVHDWGLGRNIGDFRRYLAPAMERVRGVSEAHGAPAALVGWSLGGWVAREVARDRPGFVRRVVTLGTPAVGGPKHTFLGALVHGLYTDVKALEAEIARRFERPLTVPVTAVRSLRDGFVPGHLSRDDWSPNVRHIDVDATHLGMGSCPVVLRHVGEALAADSPAAERP